MNTCQPRRAAAGMLAKNRFRVYIASFRVLHKQNTLGPLPERSAVLPDATAKRVMIVPISLCFRMTTASRSLLIMVSNGEEGAHLL